MVQPLLVARNHGGDEQLVPIPTSQQNWFIRSCGDVSHYSFPVAAELEHFPLKELQCIPKAAVLEAGLFLRAPAPGAARQGVSDVAEYYKNEGSERGVSRDPGIFLDRYFCCIIGEVMTDTFSLPHFSFWDISCAQTNAPEVTGNCSCGSCPQEYCECDVVSPVYCVSILGLSLFL